MKCPYCNSSRFDEPKSVLVGEVPECIKHLVPKITQCLECQSTFSVQVLTDPVAWAAQAAKRRQPVAAAAAA